MGATNITMQPLLALAVAALARDLLGLSSPSVDGPAARRTHLRSLFKLPLDLAYQVYYAVEKQLNYSAQSGTLAAHSLDITTTDEILRAFAEHVWNHSYIRLDGRPSLDALTRPMLGRLSLLPNLQHVEITNCPWLDHLEWTTGLPNLRCLIVENCDSFATAALEALMWGSRQLRVISLDGCTAIDDAVGTYLAGLPFLEIVSLNCTNVGDALVEALTYGVRRQQYMLTLAPTQHSRLGVQRGRGGRDRHSPATTAAVVSHTSSDETDGHWIPLHHLVELHLRETKITEKCTPYLAALPHGMEVLDLAHTAVPCWGMAPLAARFNLVCQPNAPRTLARNNLRAAATIMRGTASKCRC